MEGCSKGFPLWATVKWPAQRIGDCINKQAFARKSKSGI
jgi:hypothetical protein